MGQHNRGWRVIGSCRLALTIVSERIGMQRPPPVAMRACCCVSRLLVPPVPPMSRLKRACPAQQVVRFLENRRSNRKSETLKLRNDRFSQQSCSHKCFISTVEGCGACPAASRITVFFVMVGQVPGKPVLRGSVVDRRRPQAELGLVSTILKE